MNTWFWNDPRDGTRWLVWIAPADPGQPTRWEIGFWSMGQVSSLTTRLDSNGRPTDEGMRVLLDRARAGVG